MDPTEAQRQQDLGGEQLDLAPVEYVPGFLSPIVADSMFQILMDDLDWVQRDNTPRKEYYVNATPAPYTYGVREGQRTYEPQPSHYVIGQIQLMLIHLCGCDLDVCFLNRYDTSRDSLGWHADDSPEMDPARPIVTVSLGSERPIQFRRIGGGKPAETLLLGHGSAAIMWPGMQQEWQHRIPKVGFHAKPRISLTFRGYVA